MKTLEIKQLEGLNGGDWLDGGCAILGFTEGGLAVRYLIGATISMPGWGVGLLAVGTIACMGRGASLW